MSIYANLLKFPLNIAQPILHSTTTREKGMKTMSK